MDITAILPPTNKAGKDLIKILEKDNNSNVFKKVINVISSYSYINQQLLAQQITMQYIYDLVYSDFIIKIKNKFEPKYCSYVLNILHKKYTDFLREMRDLIANTSCNNEIINTH